MIVFQQQRSLGDWCAFYIGLIIMVQELDEAAKAQGWLTDRIAYRLTLASYGRLLAGWKLQVKPLLYAENGSGTKRPPSIDSRREPSWWRMRHFQPFPAGFYAYQSRACHIHYSMTKPTSSTAPSFPRVDCS
ncbi:hypothetical protein Dform_00531 [Dehalogenimonas formicexedens]|uniref:Uncharacterized protein n=1 Tax=Dehalogenimonas formicexedens TaxID=1839801 RepID=A0A1P8F5X7_9CHLR|nr:hypothetical protein Dform_00531 [Dehalogenimonas formicexedens]